MLGASAASACTKLIPEALMWSDSLISLPNHLKAAALERIRNTRTLKLLCVLQPTKHMRLSLTLKPSL